MGKHWARPFNQNSNRSDREKWSTSKSGPFFSKLFQLDQTDPLSFGLKFPEILVEWITPTNVLVSNIIIVISINQIVSPAYTNLAAIEESGSKKHLLCRELVTFKSMNSLNEPPLLTC